MNATRLMSNEDIIPNRVSGYRLINGQRKNESWVAPMWNTTADGVLYTNVLDMAKWHEALYTEKILKRSALNQMWTLVKLSSGTPTVYNGLGWFIAAVNGHRLIWHDGVGEAFTTGFYRYVDDRVSIVVFVNLGEDDEAATPWRIADKVASIYVPALGSSEGHETPANLSKKLLRSKD